jgi:hypothetical protein
MAEKSSSHAEIDRLAIFGCWNNKKEDYNILNKVMLSLQEYIVQNHPQLLLVAGDNYYPLKSENESGKTKIIYPQLLKDGFESLPKAIEIDMILGNHDLETNDPIKQNLYVENVSEETKEKSNCEILEQEILLSQIPERPINLVLYKSRMLVNGSLLIMFDTTIYTVESDEEPNLLRCYNILLNRQGVSVSSLGELRDIQTRFIMERIQQSKAEIRNLILVGHHPITGLKFSSKKDKKTKEKKQKLSVLNDIPHFLDILDGIFDQLGESVKYYYLCADLHLYQKGIITNTISEGKTMIINQFIVGTGGTELDMELLPGMCGQVQVPGTNLVYTCETSEAKYGFLDVSIGESVNIEFIDVANLNPTADAAIASKGGKRVNKKSKKRKSIKKSKKRKSMKRKG